MRSLFFDVRSGGAACAARRSFDAEGGALWEVYSDLSGEVEGFVVSPGTLGVYEAVRDAKIAARALSALRGRDLAVRCVEVTA